SALSLEEMSKLWSVFYQIPYVLSVAYQAGVVLLDRDVAVRAPLPVRAPANLYVVELRQPVITQVLSKADSAAPIVAGQPILTSYLLVLAGTALSGAVTTVQIDGADTPITSVSDDQIVVALP